MTRISWNWVLVCFALALLLRSIDPLPDVIWAGLAFLSLGFMVVLDLRWHRERRALELPDAPEGETPAERSGAWALFGIVLGLVLAAATMWRGGSARLGLAWILACGTSAALAGAVLGWIQRTRARPVAGVAALLVWICAVFVTLALFATLLEAPM